MGLSGFAGLGYQIVWTQQGALWLGHDAAAVLAVVAAFFGGLAVGAWMLGGRIERSAEPVRWYMACEAAIAAWGLVLVFAMPTVSGLLLDAIGPQPSASRQWTIAFAGMFVLLLPATIAMGATLPAIERVAGQGGDRRSIAAWYAANTLGAVVGVLATAFWLVPAFGLANTALLCVVLNLACAAIAWTLRTSPRIPIATIDAPASRRLLARLALTGFLGIGYEVIVVRVLGQVTEDTVYTYALLLAVYLVGHALGAAACDRFERRGHESLDAPLFATVAIACLAGGASLWGAEAFGRFLVAVLPAGYATALGAEAALAVVAFFVPTLAMGALFAHLMARANAAGVPFGRALAINTLGAMLAPLVFGVFAAPLLGAKVALLLVVAGELALVRIAAWRRPFVWIPALVAIAVAVLAPRLAFVDVPEGGQVVDYREGVMGAVSVVEDADGVARLRINNRQQEGSSATRLVDGRQALIPLLLHPAPHRALFLGLGTGVTAATATLDPAIEVDAVELLPEVIAASARFRPDDADVSRLHLLAADARRYVRTSDRRYDVVVADNFHPARSGSGTLYTVEHFRAVRERLADDGLFCQWLPLHQLDVDTVRSIVRSFLVAFPDATAILASNSLDTPVIGLVGGRRPLRFDAVEAERRLSGFDASRAFGIEDAPALLGSVVAGPSSLARFAGSAPLNTDDRPVVVYAAPRITYVADSLPRDRLTTLLDAWTVDAGEVFAPDDARRFAAYREARRLYLAAGRDVRPTNDVVAMLAQVEGPLLAALRTSPDFRPAYDPLVRMGMALGRTDPDGARRLLSSLAAIQPDRPEARDALARMGR